MKFNPVLQKVQCEYCGSVFIPEELKEKLKMSGEEEANDSYEGKAYTCAQCGASLLTFDETAITFCSYCGSQAMLEDKMIKHNNPDFVIPFKKTKEECVEAYKKKVSKFLFAPNYMKSDFVVDKFRGIYMPYVIYNLYQNGTANNTGSKYAYRRGDYVYYHDYHISADVDVSYEGMSYDLVSKFYDNFSTAIPFNTIEAVSFDSGYLAGYYADSFDVKTDVYENTANNIIKPDVEKKLKSRKEFRKYGCSSPTMSFKSDKKIGMFPVYFLAMRDKKNQNIHYAVVNGQTGKVAADLPIDFGKYILGSLLLAVILFLLINSNLVLTPIKVSVFSIVVGTIGLIISNKQIKKISIRETHADDNGINHVSKKTTLNEKKNISRKFYFVYLFWIDVDMFYIHICCRYACG